MQSHQTEVKEVYCRYCAISRSLDPNDGLGGQLLFAGELNEAASRFIRAANIAGAASLTVASDGAALRQAMRDGIVDFVVTTLDEALRILKNEIRKKQPVSVGIHSSPTAIQEEMRERGVQPDLEDEEADAEYDGREWIEITLPSGNQQLAAELDAVVLQFLPVDDFVNRRWYRLSSRYLGRSFRNLRSVACAPEVAARIRRWCQESTQA